MEKLFDQWNKLKRRLHQLKHQPPFVNEGDIWWMSMGENVGFEINGKHQTFSRPGIIFKKLSHGHYLVIPTTTKPKRGSWYVPFRHKNLETVACLHQVRAIDYRRLLSKLGQMDDKDQQKIKRGFWELYK